MSYQSKEDITRKKKCQNFEDCDKTDDPNHIGDYFHLCKKSHNCSDQDDIHKNRFVLPCPFYNNCENESIKHKIMYCPTIMQFKYVPFKTEQEIKEEKVTLKLKEIDQSFKLILSKMKEMKKEYQKEMKEL